MDHEVDQHDRVIRCEKYPLQVGDELTLYGDQVQGTYRGCSHFAIPGRYVISNVAGVAASEIHLDKTDCKNGPGDTFICGAYQLRAILSSWSEYKHVNAD